MSIYDLESLDLDNVPEFHVLPIDTEAKLRITEVNEGVGQSGLAWWRISLIPIDDDMAKGFSEMVTVPDPTIQEPRKFAGSVQRFKAFQQAFGFAATSGFNPSEALPGLEAWALLGQKEDNYGLQNTIKRWLANR